MSTLSLVVGNRLLGFKSKYKENNITPISKEGVVIDKSSIKIFIL